MCMLIPISLHIDIRRPRHALPDFARAPPCDQPSRAIDPGSTARAAGVCATPLRPRRERRCRLVASGTTRTSHRCRSPEPSRPPKRNEPWTPLLSRMPKPAVVASPHLPVRGTSPASSAPADMPEGAKPRIGDGQASPSGLPDTWALLVNTACTAHHCAPLHHCRDLHPSRSPVRGPLSHARGLSGWAAPPTPRGRAPSHRTPKRAPSRAVQGGHPSSVPPPCAAPRRMPRRRPRVAGSERPAIAPPWEGGNADRAGRATRLTSAPRCSRREGARAPEDRDSLTAPGLPDGGIRARVPRVGGVSTASSCRLVPAVSTSRGCRAYRAELDVLQDSSVRQRAFRGTTLVGPPTVSA
jgi:hypothetical protein